MGAVVRMRRMHPKIAMEKKPEEVLEPLRDSPQRDEFFRASGVYRDGGVEVGLSGAHFHSYRDALQYFIGPASDNVATDDLFLRSHRHQFHRAVRAVLSVCVVLWL